MKKLTFLILVSFTLLTIAEADAQSRRSRKGSKVRVGKTVYDFDAVDILGKLKRPDQRSIVEAPEHDFERLLDLNESFLPNIYNSVDEF